MKRVIYFADFGSSHRPYTGGYYFASALLRILREMPIELTVFSATCDKIDKWENFAEGKEIISINLPDLGFGKPRVGLSWTLQLRKKLNAIPLQDLYIFDQPMTFTDLLPKVPIIAMFHGSDYVHLHNISLLRPRAFLYDILWRRPFLNRIHRKLLHREIGTPLFNSIDTLRRLANDFGIEQEPLEQYVTYLPVDTERFFRDEEARKRIRAQYGIQEDEVVVIALSNFDAVKRADRLSSIIRRAAANGIRTKFLLVGGGRKRGAIEALTKDPAVAKMCILVGEVPHEKVNDYYSAADIALSTSERESFGYFIAEGMAAGLPFVAYDGGAIQEVIGDEKNGFVVENEDLFFDALSHLVENRELRNAMGFSARKRIEEQFSFPVFTRRFKRILQKELDM